MSEPEFSSWDVTALLRNRREAMRQRGPHGVPIDEATDPANENAFEVGLPVTDFALRLLNHEKERYRKQWPGADHDSLIWRVERKD